MLNILFDNESIADEFNIQLAARPVIPVAEARYITYEVPGRNGSLQVFDGYNDISFSLRFNYIDEHAKPKFTEIINWLSGRRTFKEAGSDHYLVLTKSIMRISDANNDIPEWCDFEITIEAEPFWYQDEGVAVIENTGTIINPSKEDAPVIIRVYGDGICRVRINDNQMEFTDVQGHVTVDGILKNAYRDNLNQNNNMRGRYPVLRHGKNEIVVEGDTDYIEVEKRWCWR